LVCRVQALQRSLAETPFHQLVIGPLERGVSRGGTATLAAWHTLWGGGAGEHPDPSDGHVHPARPVPGLLPGFTPSAALELPPLTEDTARQVSDRLLAPDFDAWSEALARVGNCTRSAFWVDLTPST